MKTHRALGSKRSNIFTLAGILSLLIVNYAASINITNTLPYPAEVSIGYTIVQTSPGRFGESCGGDKNVPIKTGETIRRDIKACRAEKVSAAVIVPMLSQPSKKVTATPYIEKPPKVITNRDNFRIVQQGSDFVIEKIQ